MTYLAHSSFEHLLFLFIFSLGLVAFTLTAVWGITVVGEKAIDRSLRLMSIRAKVIFYIANEKAIQAAIEGTPILKTRAEACYERWAKTRRG